MFLIGAFVRKDYFLCPTFAKSTFRTSEFQDFVYSSGYWFFIIFLYKRFHHALKRKIENYNAGIEAKEKFYIRENFKFCDKKFF